jgi:AraC-like DNA-binding protein/quercetin dioxygenase-like cupin family protein
VVNQNGTALPGSVVAAHSFGQTLRRQRMQGLSVEEVLMPRGLALAEHGHEDAQICFVLEGEYLEAARGRSWRLRPGTTWFRPPRELHANRVAREADALALLVTIGRDRFAALERRSTGPLLLRSALLDALRGAMHRELHGGDAGSACALEGLSLLLLARTGRLFGAAGGVGGVACDSGGPRALEPPGWLADALRLIEQSYCQPISLSTVAARFALHPATLAAACQRFRRRSVGELIRELRLRHAWHALASSRAPIKQIAAEAGFYDQAHLGRWFKRRFGISPAAVRRRGNGHPWPP